MKLKIFYTFNGGSEKNRKDKFKQLLLQSNEDRQKAKEENIPSNSTSTPSVSSTNSNPKKKSFARQKINERKDAPPNTTSSTSTSPNTTSSTSTSIKSNEFNLPFNPFSTFKNKSLSKPDDLDADILILGENHLINFNDREQLKRDFIEKGAFVFGEGELKTPKTENLDDINDTFRATIFVTSLFTKIYQRMKNNKVFVDELLKRQRDLLDRILRNEKQPPIETLIPTWNKIKEKKTQLSLELIYGLISEINDINFNFLEIYQYYFNNDDPYYDDMIVLLNLTEQGASLVNMFNENHPIHGIRFKRIMSEARERKMVERVRAYMNQQNRLTKIVIFTGKKHVENLYNELLKDKKYTVKKRNIDE